jgi:ligand-binding SRPBCC domain-containing protein
MKLYQVRYTQQLPITLQDAWAFFSDPRNLSNITPPWLAFQPTSDAPAEMYPGLILTYRIQPFPGVPMSWVTEITHVREPHYFVDEQRFGPYRFWHHQHHFRETEGGVEMEDIVHYSLPFGMVGQAVNALTVGGKVKGIFEYRRTVLEGPLLEKLKRTVE